MKIKSKTPQQGASTILVAALDPKIGVVDDEGRSPFLNDCQVWTKIPPHAQDPDDARRLWQLTEELVKEKFVW